MNAGETIEYQYLVPLYNQALLEKTIMRIILEQPHLLQYLDIFCAQLSEIDKDNFYLCYGLAKHEAEVRPWNKLVIKRRYDAAYSLFPKTHDNLHFYS